MRQEKAKEKYIDLLVQAEQALGRKEAVRLIHKADKARMKIDKSRETD